MPAWFRPCIEAVMATMSYTTIAIILTLVAVILYAVFVLYGRWSSRIDGSGQRTPGRGSHAAATDRGDRVHAGEDEHDA